VGLFDRFASLDAYASVRVMVTSTHTSSPAAANAQALAPDLAWLARVIDVRLGETDTPAATDIRALPPPTLDGDASPYANFLAHYDTGIVERLAVLLALAPHVRPSVLDALFAPNGTSPRGHADAGGLQGRQHGGFLPTGETLLFLAAGGDLAVRFAVQGLFERDHPFTAHGILHLDAAPPGEPPLAGALRPGDEIRDLLTQGTLRKPDFSPSFPARLLTTAMTWEDLVLTPDTREGLRELEAWLEHSNALLNGWGLGRRIQPGYRCLFHGPPGTGKTLTATLLGARSQLDVYRIDLSMVVSKYIGETEKNLERVFRRAEHVPCLLFFDEADSLFGKRTDVSDAHDRYANQEVAYLLQRIEDYPGLVVLATNLKANLDDAFLRRFQAVIPFPMPGRRERAALWRRALPEAAVLEEGVTVDALAERYELSGGAIMNVVRYASLLALARGDATLHRTDLVDGIRREVTKDGKTI
jgi:hypothetical protein